MKKISLFIFGIITLLTIALIFIGTPSVTGQQIRLINDQKVNLNCETFEINQGAIEGRDRNAINQNGHFFCQNRKYKTCVAVNQAYETIRFESQDGICEGVTAQDYRHAAHSCSNFNLRESESGQCQPGINNDENPLFAKDSRTNSWLSSVTCCRI